jgi:hypothetical protein
LIALRPSLATTGGPLVLTSSPNAMEGVVYDIFKRHHGPQGDPRILVVQAETKALNPKISDEVISRAFEADPTSAESEWGGQFRQLSSAYLPRSIIEGAVDWQVTGRFTLPGVRYFAHVDPSGGVGKDAMVLAIGHKNLDPQGREIAVIDALAEAQPPFDPGEIVERFASILRLWGVNEISCDHYGAAWVISAFQRHGVSVLHNSLSTSDIYVAVVPQFTSKRVRLLNHQRSIDQLCGLRRKIQNAREVVTHPAQAHDDLAAAICALLWRLSPGAKSSADWWCESMMRQANSGDTDFDDVRPAGPEWGFSFHEKSQPALIKVQVPRDIAGGAVYGPGGKMFICRFAEGKGFVEVDRQAARYLLSGPPSPWHDLNAELIEQLSAEAEQ